MSPTTESTASAPAPALWNPNAAACWSLIFSPVFGAILHMKNWQALGDSAKAEISKRWAIGCAVFLLALVFLPDNKLLDLLSRVGSLALLLSWYYSIGKPQAALVLGRYGAAYPRRGWAKPLGLALLALLGFVIVAGAVGFTAAMFTSEA